MLTHSIDRAWRRLRSKWGLRERPRVLLDNSFVTDVNRFETRPLDRHLTVNGKKVVFEQVVTRVREPFSQEHKTKSLLIDFARRLHWLALKKEVLFFTTEELVMEAYPVLENSQQASGKTHFCVQTPDNVFGGPWSRTSVGVKHIEQPIRLSLFYETGMGAFYRKADLILAIEKFLDQDLEELVRFYSCDEVKGHYRISNRMLENLKNSAPIRSLLRKTSKKHWPDIFHTWSGECAGLTHFCTLDGKFKNFWSQQGVPSKISVCSPEDLCAELGVEDPIRFLLKAGDIYDLTGKKLPSCEFDV